MSRRLQTGTQKTTPTSTQSTTKPGWDQWRDRTGGTQTRVYRKLMTNQYTSWRCTMIRDRARETSQRASVSEIEQLFILFIFSFLLYQPPIYKNTQPQHHVTCTTTSCDQYSHQSCDQNSHFTQHQHSHSRVLSSRQGKTQVDTNGLCTEKVV